VAISRNHPNRIEFANSLRGIAALMVVVSHYFGFFWRGRDVVAGQSHMPILPIDQFPSPIYSPWLNVVPHVHWGNFGVALFFLVSGFVIPLSFQRASGIAFLVGRLFRLWPTYVAATSATLLSVFLGVTYFGLAWPYTASQVAINSVIGLRDLAWSRPIDGVIWTLEVEVKFYLICAVAGPLLRSYSKVVFLVPVLLFVPALLFWHSAAANGEAAGYAYTIPFSLANCAQYIIFMFAGVAFQFTYMKRLRPAELVFLVIGLLAMLGILWASARGIASTELYSDYLLAVIVFALSMRHRTVFSGGPVVSFFANISYPLYVCHCVAGYVGLRALLNAGADVWIAQAVVFAAAISLAWIIHVVIERPTHRLGREVTARLSKRIIKPDGVIAFR